MSKSSSAAKAAQPAAPDAAKDGDHEPQTSTGAAADTDGAGADAPQTAAGADGAGEQADDAGALTSQPAVPARMRAVVIYQGGALNQRIGTVIEGPADAIDRLEIAGDVDSHPSAVEAALAGGATPVSVE